jgi:hypothetical protein
VCNEVSFLLPNIGAVEEMAMATDSNDVLRVHVNIGISAVTLKTVVATAKQIVGRDADGVYRVDTADIISEMVTRFLDQNNFESYVQDPHNYPSLKSKH